MQHKDYIILTKIVEEIDIAEEMIGNISFSDFDADEKLKRAICMTVINIGELVKNLSAELIQKYNQIPWKSISGFRDVAAHKYKSLFMDDVYNSVKEDFPALKENIENIFQDSRYSE